MSQRSVEERFDAQQVMTMAQRLPVSEIEALGESTALRETGLIRARAGDLEVARHFIADARFNMRDVFLSEEATLLFETYQLPAESFLDYLEQRFEEAREAMHRAAAAANRLSRDYGYAVELRRIHLGANLVKISMRAQAHENAVRQGMGLLRYILGDANAWPWHDLRLDRPDRLTDEAKLFVIAQVVAPLEQSVRELGLSATPGR